MCIFILKSSILVLKYTCAWDASALEMPFTSQPPHRPHRVTSHPIPFFPAVSSVGPGPPGTFLGGLLCASHSDLNSTLSICCDSCLVISQFLPRSLYLPVLVEPCSSSLLPPCALVGGGGTFLHTPRWGLCSSWLPSHPCSLTPCPLGSWQSLSPALSAVIC